MLLSISQVPFPLVRVPDGSTGRMRVGALFQIAVPVVSAVFVIGIVPVAALIVIFQERVVSGLTSGGIKGRIF